jgi:hypothetical protein
VQVLLGVLLHQCAHVALVKSHILIQVIYLGRTGLLHAGARCRYIFVTRASKDDKAWQVLRVEIHCKRRMQG